MLLLTIGTTLSVSAATQSASYVDNCLEKHKTETCGGGTATCTEKAICYEEKH